MLGKIRAGVHRSEQEEVTSMTTPVVSFGRDVSHELEQAIALSLIIRDGTIRSLSPVLRSAVHTAFAAHFRALMEFFHDGAPTPTDWARIPSERRENVKYSDIVGTGKNRYSRRWSLDDRPIRDHPRIWRPV